MSSREDDDNRRLAEGGPVIRVGWIALGPGRRLLQLVSDCIFEGELRQSPLRLTMFAAWSTEAFSLARAGASVSIPVVELGFPTAVSAIVSNQAVTWWSRKPICLRSRTPFYIDSTLERCFPDPPPLSHRLPAAPSGTTGHRRRMLSIPVTEAISRHQLRVDLPDSPEVIRENRQTRQTRQPSDAGPLCLRRYRISSTFVAALCWCCAVRRVRALQGTHAS
jgi:hypothetical protein